MKTLSLRKQADATYGGPLTLDELHERASRIGEVKVDRSISRGQYVEIAVKCPTNSLVWARGYHTDIREAYRLAIEEAIKLRDA